ncbi:MAG: 3-hydroxyacyl-CoA dehydrogenase/enoyl-CoA hydratase family protein [Armatimonadota bacterium]|nr:3-hydroxyacyl-CoA dehydrogenase/enoyl-CoA hydratase family protein [Armatimonadota bacterium]MDR7398414.1 3-hydroxyacyl-CoA dehydrogenase/enoyl-CoA hydratase family protein [Armatimonadota bacterium]MDR7407293.1 3-hydroxyacyl-CoA dehydrogenase/enoyl-CoA hydratase family protein [Armatimonadota bacterium]MDR7413709.1 3-hydroxyacyl-CoA dehydrogenase/enoyl-CoA hydratase family protein [Armatimonadota bacterium]
MPSRNIRRAAVLGAGTMGCQLAALLANAGVPVLLLDIVPTELTDEERRRELTLSHPEVRNRLSRAGLERALQMRPAAFTAPERAQLVTVGNLEDDLHRIADCDWIIEAVVEDLQVKQGLLERLERFWRPGVVVSTNTSGLPVREIAHGRSEAFRRHFLGTHFFNPPRYLRLLELIPLPDTDPAVVRWVEDVAGRVLGKGVVFCKDTPNFIANRIATFGFLHTVRVMVEEELTIEEVDELTGPFLGRPRTATFRTADLVGLDVLAHVARNSYERLADDEQREVFQLPPFVQAMLERGWLGDKSGGGFYRRTDGEVLTLDYRTLEYRPRQRPRLAGVEAVRNLEDWTRRVKAVLNAGDRAGRFLWRVLSGVLVYAARRIPEISDDLVNVDRALRWGFGWEMGPFETWDALGVREVAQRLEADGVDLPPLVRHVLDSGGTFYRRSDGTLEVFQPAARAYAPVRWPEGVLVLRERKAQGGVVAHNAGASLVDLGDGVLCVEFHTKMNAIGEDIVRMLHQALREAERGFEAVVVANQGPDFSAGANLVLLLVEAQEGNWEELDLAVRTFQQLNQAVKYFPKPVVVAPHGRTLGGGCELVLHASRVQAAMETYMGLVETAVGLIPAGGGVKETATRVAERFPEEVAGDLFPLLRWAFELVATARVATSAEECRKFGFLRPGDGITLNPDRLVADAKEVALSLVRTGYRPPLRRPVRVGGERVRAALYAGLHNLRVAGHITEYDEYVGRKLAYVLTGGDVPEGARVDEQHLLDLEREVFLSLLGEPRTQERIRHMLERGRPLRN